MTRIPAQTTEANFGTINPRKLLPIPVSFTVCELVYDSKQETVLYRTVDSVSAVGLLEKNVRNRQCLFCGIQMRDHSILTDAIDTQLA